MSGSITVGGKILASHDNVSGKLSMSENVDMSNVVFPAGHVIQIQSVVDNSIDSSGSINVTDWTLQPNMQITITPRQNNSYFFLIGRCSGENSNDEHRLNFAFFRDGNRINVGQDSGVIVGSMFVGYSAYYGGDNASTPISPMFQTLDKTPGTIAGTQIVFEIKLKEQNSISTAWYYNRALTMTDAGQYEKLSSELIVMEIAQ